MVLMINIKLLTTLLEDAIVYKTDTTRWTSPDLGLLTCRDIPRLFHQPDSRIHRILNLCETDSAERRCIIAEVRRILRYMLRVKPGCHKQ